MLHFIRHITLIGLGGIGSWVAPPLLRFLNAEGFGGSVLLADGDTFALENLARQDACISDIGKPKAEAFAQRMAPLFPGLSLRSFCQFITDENVAAVAPDRSLVVVAVDNHPARAVVARHAATLRETCVLSAGNEKYDGNVHVTLRRSGRDLTVPLLDRHPEIATFKAGNRATMGCEELAQAGEAQILFTNFLAAASLLAAFYTLWNPDGIKRSLRGRKPEMLQEVYFDLRTAAMSAVPAASMVNAGEAVPCPC